jgi:hypothetical protein
MSANGRENVRMELYGQAVRRFGELTGPCVSRSCRRTMNCKQPFVLSIENVCGLPPCMPQPRCLLTASSRHLYDELVRYRPATSGRRGCDADHDIHKRKQVSSPTLEVDRFVFPSCNWPLNDRVFCCDFIGGSHVHCFGISGARSRPIGNGG